VAGPGGGGADDPVDHRRGIVRDGHQIARSAAARTHRPPSGGGGDAIRVRDRATRRCRHRRDHRPADRVRVEQPLAVQFQRTELGVDEAFDVVGSDSDLVVVPHAPELLALREEEVGEVRCSGTGTAQRDDPAQARGVHPGEERVVLGRVQLPDGSGRVSGGSRASRCSVSDVTGVDIEDIGPGADAGAPVSVVLSQTSVAALVRLSSVVSSAALRASSATVSAVSAPARSAAARPTTTWSWARWRCSSRTSISARVPAVSPCALQAAAHQASWTGVNLPARRTGHGCARPLSAIRKGNHSTGTGSRAR
jgi:hypothetical protein